MTYKNYKIWIEYDIESDCRKCFHYAQHIKTQQTFLADISPYEDNLEVIKLWIDSGKPKRIGIGPLTTKQLKELLPPILPYV